MKTMIGVIILAVLCLGLGIALLTTKKHAVEEQQKSTERIQYFSNEVVQTSGKLDEQKQVNLNLEKDVDARKQQLGDLTNKITEVSTTLAKTEESLKATKEEVTKRDTRISELEQQNQALDQRASDLSFAITNLTSQITETQGKLTRSEGDKAFLEKELKRLMAEKAELERQFNDLAVVRAQVAKLKEELNVSRRLEWIRKGLFAANEQKGAERLVQKAPLAAAPSTNHYDLNVEVNADGSVRVLAPTTNAPAK
jgi:chromosome segregation ATPase